MADKALIQGAAAVAAGKAAKGMAFRESMATSAGNLALKIAETVQKREQKIADGSALAKANFMTWDTNGLPPKYAELIQKEMAAANEKLNETGKDINISGAAQKTIMDKIVRDAENKAKSYVQNIELEREVGALNMQLEDPQIAQTVSGLVDPDIHDKITKVGGGNYTLDNNNNYIFEGDEKAYSFQEVQEMVQKFKNSTYDRTQVAGIRNSNLEIAARSKNQKDYETNIDNLMKGAYSLTNPKDVFQMKAELVNVYEQQPEDVNELNPQQLYDRLKQIRIDYGKETVPEPVMEPVNGAQTFKNITSSVNRYIKNGALGDQMVKSGVKIKGAEVISSTEVDANGDITVDVVFTKTGGGKAVPVKLNIFNKDDRKLIDQAFANENYSGKTLENFNNFYFEYINDAGSEEEESIIDMGDFENSLKGGIEDTLSDIKRTKSKKDAFDIGLNNKINVKPELNIREKSSIPTVNRKIN